MSKYTTNFEDNLGICRSYCFDCSFCTYFRPSSNLTSCIRCSCKSAQHAAILGCTNNSCSTICFQFKLQRLSGLCENCGHNAFEHKFQVRPSNLPGIRFNSFDTIDSCRQGQVDNNSEDTKEILSGSCRSISPIVGRVSSSRLKSIQNRPRERYAFGTKVSKSGTKPQKPKIYTVFAHPVNRVSHGRLVNAPNLYRNFIVSGTEEELKSISVFDLTRKCRHRFFKPGKVISKDVVFGDRSPVPITDDMWPSYFIERETRKEINLFYFCPDLGHDHPTVEKKSTPAEALFQTQIRSFKCLDYNVEDTDEEYEPTFFNDDRDVNELRIDTFSENPITKSSLINSDKISPNVFSCHDCLFFNSDRKNVVESLIKREKQQCLKCNADESLDEYKLIANRSDVLDSWLNHWLTFQQEKNFNDGSATYEYELKISFFADGEMEVAIDCGGPTQEFLSLFMQHCLRSNLINVFDSGMAAFNCNPAAYANNSYRFLGQAVGYSILQGGPGLPIFPRILVKYLQTGNVNEISIFHPMDFSDVRVQVLLSELKNTTSEINFRSTLNIFQADYPQFNFLGNISVADFSSVCRLLAFNWILPQYPFIQQFKVGLEDYNIIKMLCENTDVSIFLSSCACLELSVSDVWNWLKFSSTDTDNDTIEKMLQQHFLKFLNNLYNGQLLHPYASNQQKLGLTDFVKFFSGSGTRTILKSRQLEINWTWNEDGEPFNTEDIKIPIVSTCFFSVNFPVYYCHLKFNKFEEFMIHLISSGNFNMI